MLGFGSSATLGPAPTRPGSRTIEIEIQQAADAIEQCALGVRVEPIGRFLADEH